MNTQKLEQVPIDKLVPYARNARTHSKEQIAQLRASLREFGFVSPAVIDAGFHLAGVCIWVKNSLVLGRSDYQWQHEPVLYGFLQNGKHPWYSDRKQTTIWNYDKPKRNKDHPTSKPLDLLGYPIQNSSQENSVVIDTFGGSGSTLMACEQLNRICYMMELDPKYASVILRRYVEDTGDGENVYVIRNGEKLFYSALAKEVETSPTAGV